MRLIRTIFFATAFILSFNQAQAWDWSSLSGVVSSVVGEDVANVVDNIIKTDKIEVADLAGTWTTNGAAVSFKSENLLEQAGGVAAASTIENKINPYYKRIGLDKATFEFTKEGELIITLRNGTKINGVVTKGETEGTMTFAFKDLKNLGKLTAYVSKGTTLSIMFDTTKFVKLLSSIANYAGSSSLSTVSTLLNTYEGMYVGFKFEKQ